MSFYYQLRLWFSNHWGKLLAVAIGVPTITLIAWGVVAFVNMESFYRQQVVGQVPVHFFIGIVHAIAFVFLYATIFRGQFSGLRSNTKVKTESVTVSFKDVIGLENPKKESMQVVQLLRDRAKLRAIGGQVVKGILMFGPPGTGKTYLAKAIATEAKVPFLSMSGSEFVEVFVGVGSSRVRSLFKKARLLARAHGACIVFIDEIDALGQRRKFSAFGSQESDSTLNQLLVEMDGLGDMQGNVLIIGATNAAEEKMDPALLRPGRFDLHIHLQNPNLNERVDLFRYYLKKVKHDPSLDIGRLARRCVTKSPADIMNIVKEAALIAIREKSSVVQYAHLSQAIERVDLGTANPVTMTPEEKHATAIHEAGHLVVLYHLHPTDDVFKASVIARGGALGMVYHTPREERHTADRNRLIADIKASLAGYLAEKIKYGVTSNGVAADFQNAMAKARAMVWDLGMGTNGFIGNYSMLMGDLRDGLSEKFKERLNEETHAILRQCGEETEAFLRKEWPIVERFGAELVARNELEYDDIHAIFAEYGQARPQAPVQSVAADEPAAASAPAAPAPSSSA